MGHKSKATKKNKAKKENRGEIKRTLQGKRQKGHNLPSRGSGGLKVSITSAELKEWYDNNVVIKMGTA